MVAPYVSATMMAESCAVNLSDPIAVRVLKLQG
jgi:hypothetical protein